MGDEKKPPIPIKPESTEFISNYPRRDVYNRITDVEFGSTVLGILKRASFPGESAETVVDLKQICTAIEAGRLVLCENSA